MNICGRPGLAACIMLACLVGCGSLFAEDERGRRAEELRKRLRSLRSVPYTMVSEDRVDSTAVGVTIHEKAKAWRGYNLYCSVTRSQVILMDMDGSEIHTWTYPAEEFYTWEHAIMMENGDVIVIRKFHDLLRLDWNSNLIWRAEMEIHHEVTEVQDGTFYAVAREQCDYKGMKIHFPAVVHLSSGGRELHRWRTFESLDDIKQKFDPRLLIDVVLDSLVTEVSALSAEAAKAFMDSMASGIMPWGRRGDQFHMNTISILPDTPLGRSDSRFRPGNLLICFRNLNQVGILDRDTWEFLWTWGADDLDWPHLPIMLESGNILIFDNGTHRIYSRLIELNPVTEEIEWEFVADSPRDFFTPTKGSAQRLANGNTLVCEGDRGKAFEITREGQIVWEWINPATRKHHREQIYRMWRIEPEAVEPLMAKYKSR